MSKTQTVRSAAEMRLLVTVRCRDCANAASFLATDLATVCKPEKPLEALGFRCKECTSRLFDVETRELDRDRRPSIIVWRPTRLD